MHSFLDMRTLTLVAGLVALLMGLCMCGVAFTSRTYAGFRAWATGSILHFVANVLLSMRNILPDFITFVVANTLAIGALSLTLYGLAQFCGRKQRPVLHAALLLAVAVGIAVFTFVHPSIKSRLVLLSTCVLLLCLNCIYIVYQHVGAILPRRNWLLLAGLGILAGWHAIRIPICILHSDAALDFATAAWPHGVTFFVSITGSVLVITGLIILNSQRVECDLVAARNEIRTLKGFLPICAGCKMIRDDKGYWSQVEDYITQHTDVQFSHGLCPTCLDKYYPERKKS